MATQNIIPNTDSTPNLTTLYTPSTPNLTTLYTIPPTQTTPSPPIQTSSSTSNLTTLYTIPSPPIQTSTSVEIPNINSNSDIRTIEKKCGKSIFTIIFIILLILSITIILLSYYGILDSIFGISECDRIYYGPYNEHNSCLSEWWKSSGCTEDLPSLTENDYRYLNVLIPEQIKYKMTSHCKN